VINSTTNIQTTLTGLAVDASGKATLHFQPALITSCFQFIIKSKMIFLVLENIKGLKSQELQDPADAAKADAAKGVGIMILPPGAINNAKRIEEATATTTTTATTTIQ